MNKDGKGNIVWSRGEMLSLNHTQRILMAIDEYGTVTAREISGNFTGGTPGEKRTNALSKLCDLRRQGILERDDRGRWGRC